jgi:hypothetical protein
MPLKKHKVPGHLEQPDHILFGLTARQTLLLACGITCAGMAWVNNAGGVAGTVLAFILALTAILAACAVAFLAPARRGLEVWAVVGLTYVFIPRLYLWRPLCEIEAVERDVPRPVSAAGPLSLEEEI